MTDRGARRDVAAGPSRWPLLTAVGLAIAFGLTFSLLSVARHLAFQSDAFDLGNMDQAVWNTLHGAPFRFTDMAVGHRVLTTRLAIHVEPLLLPLSLAYLIHSGPSTLLVLQAFGVGAGAVPAYLLGRETLGMPRLALVFPIGYVLHPSLQHAVLFDFHPVTLSATFLLWALYAAYVRQGGPFAVASILALSTKENIGFLVAGMALVSFLLHRSRTAAVFTVLGVAWTAVCLLVIIPHFNPAGHSPYLSRYAYLGKGFAGVLAGIVHHPGKLALLGSTPRLAYLDALFDPLGYVPLLGLPLLLPALPSLALNMLSSDPTMYSGQYQYNAEILPFLIGGAALGTGLVGRYRRGPAIALCLLVVVASLLSDRLEGFTPLASGFVAPSMGPRAAIVERELTKIPHGAIVAADNSLEPHLSDRRTIYLLPTVHPNNSPAAQYVVMDASVPALDPSPAGLHRLTVDALRHGYGVRAAQDGLLLLRYGAPRRTLPPSFFSFAYAPAPSGTHAGTRWGAWVLLAAVVHPRSRSVNRARPSIGVETYWRAPAPLRRGSIGVYMSPVYSGPSPAFSASWQVERDSPTIAWLPPARWPRGRTIHVVSLPFEPDVLRRGKVDIAVGVQGAGPVSGGSLVAGTNWLRRIATVEVGP